MSRVTEEEEDLPRDQDEGRSSTKEPLLPSLQAPTSRRTLTFIDSSTQQARSNEAVRVHVLRESHRARRLAQRHLTSTPSRGELHLWEIGNNAGSVPRRSLTERVGGERSGSTIASAQPPEVTEHQLQPFNGNPQGILGAGRRDPFGQYPARQSYRVDYLVDFYVNSKAHLSHDLLPIYRDDSTSFHALLAIAAMLLAERHGQDPIYRQAELELESQTLNILSGRLAAAPQQQTNGTIMGVAILAQLEECRENNPTARLHWKAVTQMIQDRGGLRSISSDLYLHCALIRLDVLICTSWRSNLQQPYTRPCPGDTSVPILSLSHAIALSEYPPKQDFPSASEEFISFFGDLVTRLSNDIEPSVAIPSPIADTFGQVNEAPLMPLKEKMTNCAKMACLIYLASVQSNQSAQMGQNAATMMQALNEETRRRKADHAVCAEELLYVLFISTGTSTHDALNQRVWLVSRLMGVARMLGPQSWKMCDDILAHFLGLADGVSTRAQIIASWEPHVIREELDGCDLSLGMDT